MKKSITQKCLICKSKISGRADKRFCSLDCKNDYHSRLRKATLKATKPIDKILHRNRSILLEILGKRIQSKKIDRSVLDKKNFNYSYVTGYQLNSKNKMVNYVYDFSWILFSDKQILLKRLK